MTSDRNRPGLGPVFPEATRARLAFLVYDSRSGSTFLASKLARAVGHLAVTPELRFDRMLRGARSARGRLDSRPLLDSLFARDSMRNLATSRDRVEEAIEAEATRLSPESLLRLTLGFHLRADGQDDPDVILIKAGPHAFVWEEIRGALPGASFIYVIRDPRAVVNSKIKTRRPYFPAENMAWPGAALSAYRWTMYSRAMRRAARAGVPVLPVRYEDALADVDAVLQDCAAFLGLPLATGAGERRDAYRIPDAERQIHRLVAEGQAVRERADAWRKELSGRAVRLVETVAQDEMRLRGYRPDRERGRLLRAGILGLHSPVALAKLARHALVLLGVVR